jgi:hypothetical protein
MYHNYVQQNHVNQDEVTALLHPNVLNDDFPQQIFMIKGPFGSV